MKIWSAGEIVDADDLNANFLALKYNGDGSDGALSISSGTTTIDCDGKAIVVKNYTSISITGTGKLAFSNPHAGGTLVVLLSQGDVTLTATAPCIDMRGMGAAPGNTPNFFRGSAVVSPTGATAGVVWDKLTEYTSYMEAQDLVLKKSIVIAPGAAGADGGNPSIGDSVPGDGGRGGGALYIECAGAWNFTTANGIDISGSDGTNATAGSGTINFCGAGGGGGGNCGQLVGLYETVTANTGTVKAIGGEGGDGADNSYSFNVSNAGGPGGGGAGSLEGEGGDGAAGTTGNASPGEDATHPGSGAGGGAGQGHTNSVQGAASAGGVASASSTQSYFIGQKKVFS
jgi:hypothetical protein